MSLRSDLINALYDENQKYDVCGIISAEGKIYPLGSDTKVLSTIFELLTLRLFLSRFSSCSSTSTSVSSLTLYFLVLTKSLSWLYSLQTKRTK